LFQAPSYLTYLKMQTEGALASGISWSVFMVPATVILAMGAGKHAAKGILEYLGVAKAE